MKSTAAIGKIILLTLLSASILLWGCRTPPEIIEEEIVPVSLPEPPVLPAEPEPFITEWAGTTWIFRDVPEGSKEFPGYRGFHLGRDGRLLLINMDEAAGDTWSAADNSLTLNLLSKSKMPSLPVAGNFKAYYPKESVDGMDSDVPRIFLQPAASAESPAGEGLVLELAKARIDIIENHWIPREMDRGRSVRWPGNREIFLMVLPNEKGGMGILGFGGENRFRGDVSLGIEEFVTGTIGITAIVGPSSNFEMVYVDNILSTNRYVQVDDDLFLYEDTRPTAAFRARLFD